MRDLYDLHGVSGPGERDTQLYDPTRNRLIDGLAKGSIECII